MLAGAAIWVVAGVAHAERINHEGRILGPEPVVESPILFHTPEADAVVSAMQIMPRDNPWNEDVSRRPVLAGSPAMISQVKADLAAIAANRQTLRPFYEMNYVLIPANQPPIDVEFVTYPDESDLDGGEEPIGRYPIPSVMPIEGWPREVPGLSLEDWQTDINDDGGDRHAIIVQPATGDLWEMWQAKRIGSNWEASNGAKFNLGSNALRPLSWTSADAAGLQMFPAVVRHDECMRGKVEHALRLIVARTRREFIYPATHYASSSTSVNRPAMGQRFRLKAGFSVPASWTIHAKAVCHALKKYGALVADNGNFFSVSVSPDPRFPSGAFDQLRTIDIDQFEVVESTGLNEGPRSPNPPAADAGPDQVIPSGSFACLDGTVAATLPATIRWAKSSGPGEVAFTAPDQPDTCATFSADGVYTLLLSADDGIHAVAYDAVIVHAGWELQIERNDPSMTLRFPTDTGRTYQLERSPDLAPHNWSAVGAPVLGNGEEVEIDVPGGSADSRQFFRVRTP
jgi:hypothetical protein